jgi:hypothetical protein
MEDTFESLLQVLPRETPPSYLCERILSVVALEHTRQRRVRLVVSSFSGASSLVALAFAVPALIHAASVTGFNSYASLFMTDSDVMTSHFSTFALSIMEALPGFEVTVTLFLLAVFLVSLQNFVRNLRKFEGQLWEHTPTPAH